MSSYETIYQKTVERLNRLRLKEKKFNLAKGGLVFVSVLTGLILVPLILETLFHLGPQARVFLLILSIGAGVAALVWFIFIPLYSLLFRSQSPNDIFLALKVGDHFHHIRDRLANALQVFEKHKHNPEGYSLDLADASLVSMDDEIKEVRFDDVIKFSHLKGLAKIFGFSLAGFCAIYFLFASNLSEAAYRLAHPLRDFPKMAGLRIKVSPGNTEIIKGESVEFKAQMEGDRVASAVLAVQYAEAKNYERIQLEKKQDGEFAFTLADIKDDLKYFVEAGATTSDEYAIKVVELPYVRHLQLNLKYPKYSKLGTQLLDENVGDVTALKGTAVNVSIKTNKTVNQAELIFNDDKKIPLSISGQSVTGNFVLTNDGSYHIKLIDTKDRPNDSPIEYRLTMIPDEYPLIQITYPAQDVDLGKDMLVPLTIEAQDDFGFSKLRLGYTILAGGVNEGALQHLELGLPGDKDEQLLLNYTWDLSKLNLFPEDVVTYHAEVFDNDVVSGPKSAKSQTYRVRFPSIYEIYDEVAQGQDETYEGLEDVYDESKNLQENLGKIVQEMKRQTELNWEEKQSIEEAQQAQQKMHEQLEDIQQKLDEMIDRMEQNDLISPETLEKYRELQQLMDEVVTPEMKELMRELQKSMEEIDPQKLKETMERFAESQEEFQKSIERTLNLLKQLQIEQKLDESLRKAQELLRRQEELNKKVAESQKQEGNKYARDQKGIREDTKDLGQDLNELKKRMDEFPTMPQDQVESARNMVQQGELPNQMQRAVQQMQSGDMSGAQQSGQQASQNLEQLVQQLQSAKDQLTEQQKKELMQAFNRSAHNMLTLSKEQENLMQQTQGKDRNSPDIGELADKQQDMLSGLSRLSNELYELSQKTFFITPEIGKALGKSMNGMNSAIEDFEGRDPGKATQNQANAMSGLNEAAAQLRQSMQNMSGASSAIGFQEMMQRLMDMAGQQQGINQQTAQMGQQGEQGQQGGMSLEQQAALSRLAAEQSALRKSLDQLRKEAGNRSEILGDLGKVSQDMEEAAKEMEQRNLNRPLIDRQRRILSRLLDAQRSMHQREYSKKRQAETGKEYETSSPRALPTDLRSQKDRIKDDLLKALKEGYTRDYQELIKKYFEALAAEQDQGPTNN